MRGKRERERERAAYSRGRKCRKYMAAVVVVWYLRIHVRVLYTVVQRYEAGAVFRTRLCIAYSAGARDKE